MIDKRLLRKKIRAMRLALSDEERNVASAAVFERLEQTAAFQSASRIMMYYSLPDEVSTIDFLRKWCDRKQFFLPRVNGDLLDILPYDDSKLQSGSFNIEEPVGNDLVDPAVLELIVIPAVAFDRKGNRIGRGKGYYDRFLKSVNAEKIGVAYHFQLSDEVIETEEHDIPVDMVITDKCTIVTN